MQFLKAPLSHVVFGILCPSGFPVLQRLKAEAQCFELQDCDVENQFWICDVQHPNVLILEVNPTQSIDFIESYLRQWRSFNLPIIWLMEAEINQQSLSHPIYYQLTQNVSGAGECILDRNSASVYSLIAIASSLLYQSRLQSRIDMLSMVIHDLRSPLNVISLACEMLDKIPLSPLALPKIQQIRLAYHSLKLLADTLLSMVKLESEKLRISAIDCNIGLLLEQITEELEPIAQQHHINLHLSLPRSPIAMLIDPNLIKRVMDNLITNAIKFSPAHSQVNISMVPHPNRPNLQQASAPSTQKSNSQVFIRVQDAGCGIEPEVQPSIFKKYAIGNSLAGIPQIGLGLAFCKMAVEAHGGLLSMVSNPSQGTTFMIEL